MIGIIPCGGRATRIHEIPKFLLPLPDGTLLDHLHVKMEAVSPRLIALVTKGSNAEYLHPFEVGRTVIRDWNDRNMSDAVLLSRQLIQGDECSIFGMPDTYFEDQAAYSKLVTLVEGGADVAVGVFHARPPQHTEGGMCVLDGDRVTKVVDKSTERVSEWIWGALAWRPGFWEHLSSSDPHVGYGVQRAIENGMNVQAVRMAGEFWDAGTPDRYFTLLDELRGR